MKPLDKQYLSLQFKIKIYSKYGTEFQSFFEDIMEKAFPDFQIISPHGNLGDGGNDGYRKDSGIYYQVYAPKEPIIKEKEAAKKLKKDFHKLKLSWDEISKIKEYYFVYNNKYDGSVILLEEAITCLETTNPEIDFKLYLAKDLERDFFQLKDSDILDLGFNIDRRQVIENAYCYLDIVKVELDKDNVIFAQKTLENSKDIFLVLDDENLLLEYEILISISLQRLEKYIEAREMLENISIRYPSDPRPILYLAEIYLHEKDLEKNAELLEKAEELDESFWLLELEKFIRRLQLGEIIDIDIIEEKRFPEDPRIKASFYRLYGIYLEFLGNQTKADSFIEKAIKLNSHRFSNYLDKISIIESRMFQTEDPVHQLHMADELLELIDDVEKLFGDIGSRNRAILNSKKLSAFLLQENMREFDFFSQITFDLIIKCYFNVQIG